MTDQQQIDRLIKVLEAYKRLRYPLDLTETEIEIVIDALKTKKSLYEYMARMKWEVDKRNDKRGVHIILRNVAREGEADS